MSNIANLLTKEDWKRLGFTDSGREPANHRLSFQNDNFVYDDDGKDEHNDIKSTANNDATPIVLQQKSVTSTDISTGPSQLPDVSKTILSKEDNRIAEEATLRNVKPNNQPVQLSEDSQQPTTKQGFNNNETSSYSLSITQSSSSHKPINSNNKSTTELQPGTTLDSLQNELDIPSFKDCVLVIQNLHADKKEDCLPDDGNQKQLPNSECIPQSKLPDSNQEPPNYDQIIKIIKMDKIIDTNEDITIYGKPENVKIDMLEDTPCYSVVLSNTNAWQNVNKLTLHDKIRASIRKNEKTLPPNYNSLIEHILQDSPPDYESVTGIHVNVDEIAKESKRDVRSRNVRDENTRTCDEFYKSSQTRMFFFIFLFLCLMAIAGFIVAKIMKETAS